VFFNSTNATDGSTPAFVSDLLEDGDHALTGEIDSLQLNRRIEVHYFEYVASFSTGTIQMRVF
jgi:hypothetical protein